MRQTPVSVIVLVAVAFVGLAVRPAVAQNRCAGAKLKAAAKASRCLLKEEAKAALDGSLDVEDVQLCHAKLLATFTKVEFRPPCLTTGDGQEIDDKISAFVADVSGQLAPGAPDEKKCQSLKIKASGAKAKCLLTLEARSTAKGIPIDPLRQMRCFDKFAAVFADVEAQHHCTTTGDAQDIEDTVDAFVVDVVTELTPAGSPSGAFAAGELRAD
jgi:hypothetical protein